MRIALGLEYDGSGFCGWQSQAGGGSVQDALESALSVVADAPTRAACAGRTDAGVHAAGAGGAFRGAGGAAGDAWVRGVNAHLPDSVAVRWARRCRTISMRASRRYRAAIATCSTTMPCVRRCWHGRVGWFHLPLDVVAMLSGAALLRASTTFPPFAPPSARPSRR
jgi:tRNA pseudouridine38-40 synthase